MGLQREDKALREFKHIIDDLVTLLRESTGADTVYMYWVNRTREQFVMEANSTSLPSVMFQDRVAFQDYFLYPFTDLQKIRQLNIGEEIEYSQLYHYYDQSPVRQITIVPFINNGETVALIVLETAKQFFTGDNEPVIQSFLNALGNVLNTYLELTDLYEQQHEWIEYEKSLDTLSSRLHKVEILSRMLTGMQKLLPSGGVSLVARGMDVWVNVLNSAESEMAPPLGLMIDEKSVAYDSLKNGKPEFAIHFNQNPKRLTAGEPNTEGATLAIPLMIDDRRHGSVIVYDKNALTFSESVKHKLINLVRVAALAIRTNLDKLPPNEDLLTTTFSSFIPDVWEKAIETSLSDGSHLQKKTWFGLLTIDNLQSLRSKHRLEELKRLQRTLVAALNPTRFGVNGYIGFNSDYVFTFLLQDKENTAPEKWLEGVKKMLENPVQLSDGKQFNVEIIAGYTLVEGEGGGGFHPIVQQAKKGLSEAVRKSDAEKKISDLY